MGTNSQYGKVLIPVGGKHDGFNKEMGEKLEIIPRQDPFSMKPGQKLEVEVRFEGKPLAGAGVEIGDGITPMKEEEIPRYKTNENGIASIPITRTGWQVIALDYKVPSSFPDLAVDDAFSATLTFVLGK